MPKNRAESTTSRVQSSRLFSWQFNAHRWRKEERKRCGQKNPGDVTIIDTDISASSHHTQRYPLFLLFLNSHRPGRYVKMLSAISDRGTAWDGAMDSHVDAGNGSVRHHGSVIGYQYIRIRFTVFKFTHWYSRKTVYSNQNQRITQIDES